MQVAASAETKSRAVVPVHSPQRCQCRNLSLSWESAFVFMGEIEKKDAHDPLIKSEQLVLHIPNDVQKSSKTLLHGRDNTE